MRAQGPGEFDSEHGFAVAAFVLGQGFPSAFFPLLVMLISLVYFTHTHTHTVTHVLRRD